MTYKTPQKNLRIMRARKFGAKEEAADVAASSSRAARSAVRRPFVSAISPHAWELTTIPTFQPNSN